VWWHPAQPPRVGEFDPQRLEIRDLEVNDDAGPSASDHSRTVLSADAVAKIRPAASAAARTMGAVSMPVSTRRIGSLLGRCWP
jgi:hypothetical protein